MTNDAAKAERLFAEVVKELSGLRSVSTARMFGAPCLKVSGKIFAVAYKGQLALKLPADRVSAIVKSGKGTLFDSGSGRTSKEWAAVPPGPKASWIKLATEAYQFVASKL